jgi:hypothetical protein
MRDFKEHDAAGRFCRNTTSSATSSAADLVITNTFLQPVDAVTSSTTPAW